MYKVCGIKDALFSFSDNFLLQEMQLHNKIELNKFSTMPGIERGVYRTINLGGEGMKLIFVGAAHEVTGSCHYIEVGGKHILVDYGMEQGVNVFENAPLPVDESLIDYVLLTHAHIDHTGLLPLLYAKGFRGQVYATDATADLCSIMLRDCAHIQMMEAEWKSRKSSRC